MLTFDAIKRMKNKRYLLLLFVIIVTLLYNSCKKNNQSPIATLFTGGTWQLASVLVFNYTGNTQTSTDTLNDSCKLTQFFTFNKDKTCTYQNFDCLPNTMGSGTWSLTANQLFLQAAMTCTDTTKAGSSQPFAYAQIMNLGEYSLVLETGDIQPNYSLTKLRRVVQYGFVRRQTTASTP